MIKNLGLVSNKQSCPLIGSDKKINEVITVKVVSSDNKGFVKPGCDLEFIIKNQIAINTADARPSRFVE